MISQLLEQLAMGGLSSALQGRVGGHALGAELDQMVPNLSVFPPDSSMVAYRIRLSFSVTSIWVGKVAQKTTIKIGLKLTLSGIRLVQKFKTLKIISKSVIAFAPT